MRIPLLDISEAHEAREHEEEIEEQQLVELSRSGQAEESENLQRDSTEQEQNDEAVSDAQQPFQEGGVPGRLASTRRFVAEWVGRVGKVRRAMSLLVLLVVGVSSLALWVEIQPGRGTVWYSDEDRSSLWIDEGYLEEKPRFEGPKYPVWHIERLRDETECTNLDQVLEQVGFSQPWASPYPEYGYNTEIDMESSCFVVFQDEESRLLSHSERKGKKIPYRLVTARERDMALLNTTTLGVGTIFKTHSHACGACSTLDALASYLLKPDMTNPVRRCGLRLIKERAVECLQKGVGLPGACGWIWYWNTRNTKESSSGNGCFRTCALRVWSSNNEPQGSNNPCDPHVCQNRINGGPACSDFQWQNGPFRLNPCLQCDECKSGPIFQKVAGRTRRASGIDSAIARPDRELSEVYHFYGFQDVFPSRPPQ